LLRYSFHLDREAACIESAVGKVLERGHRTIDLAKRGDTAIGSAEMSGKVAEEVKQTVHSGTEKQARQQQSA
jgi:3-isopropylmalate dehydrogenase